MTALDDLTAQVTDGLEAPDTAAGAEEPQPIGLPDEFWTARSELAAIRQAAHCRTRPADCVLAGVLGTIAALVPPQVRLPAPVGTPGTLETFYALVGPSGSGKSSSFRVAQELIPTTDDVKEINLGSGEGVIEAYFDEVEESTDDGKRTKLVKRQVYRSVLAYLDEGQALMDIGNRKGAILLPTLRTAWTGDRLGQGNASKETKRDLKAGEFRFVLVVGFQPQYATSLLDDAAGGTPQRFVFLSSIDPTIPDQAPDWPTSLNWELPSRAPCVMSIDPTINTEIRARSLALARGQVTIDPLDSHRDLSRLKVAGLLALLAQRLDINAEDWHLAGMILDTSDRVRSSIAQAARFHAREREKSTTARKAREEAGLEENRTRRALEGMARAIARHVARGACGGPCRRRCATQATKSAHRRLVTIDEALDHAKRKGWIGWRGDEITPGQEIP